MISGLLFTIICWKDPGYVKHADNLLDLYEKYRPEYICPYCKVKKGKNTKHCQHCNHCIKVRFKKDFDHHCPWIRNCVGKENKKLFLAFISCTCLDYFFHAVLGLFDYASISEQKKLTIIESPEFSLMISIFCALCLIFVLPICIVQVTNFIKGTTTHKRFAYHISTVSSDLSEESDTRSMLLKETDDSMPESVKNSKNMYENDDTSSSCFSTKRRKRNRIEPIHLSLMTIR